MNVWINGCFDVLHHGHFQLISYAKSFGGNLRIGIDSDKRIKESIKNHNFKDRIYYILKECGTFYL